MAKIDVAITTELDDDLFHKIIANDELFTFQFQPSGMYLLQILKKLSPGRPLTIVETGCIRDTQASAAFSDGWSTLYLAKYAKRTGSSFVSIEPDSDAIEKCQDFLASYGLRDYVIFKNGESPAALQDLGADFYFLDSCDGLEHGLAEFKAALVHKPKVIVMDDFNTKAKLAAEFAAEVGIPIQRIDRYTVFDLTGAN